MTNNHDPGTCRKCFYLRLAAVVLWTSALVAASLVSVTENIPSFSGQDKVLHFIVYLLTALLACRALGLFSFSLKKTVLISTIYCVFLGGLLEVLQGTLTVNRQADTFDMLANLAGALSGCALFCLFAVRRSVKGEPGYESDSSEN